MKLLKKSFVVILCVSLLLTMIGFYQTETSVYGMTGKSCSAEYQKSPYYATLNKVNLTGNLRSDIVNVALSQTGYLEGTLAGTVEKSMDITEYGRWIGNQTTWCAIFVSWCAYQAGVPTNVIRKTSAPASVCGIWTEYSANAVLQPGDIIFVNNNNGNHVGIVWKVDGTYIYAVEGNMSNKVRSDVKYRRSDGRCTFGNYYAVISKYCSPAYGGSSSTINPPTQCSHSYVTESETLHPHKEYKRCTKCGYTYYTGNTVKVPSCTACNPPTKLNNVINLTSTIPASGIAEGTNFQLAGTVTSNYNVGSVTATLNGGKNVSIFYDSGSMNVKSYDLAKLNSGINISKLAAGTYTLQINMVNVGTSTVPCTRTSKTWTIKIVPKTCSHTYVTESEALHPHKEYKRCTKCGYTYYTGNTVKVPSCTACNPSTKLNNVINLTSTIPASGIAEGTNFKLTGTVTSNYNVGSVTATLNGGKNVSIFCDSGSMNVKSYDLAKLNSGINISKLAAGTYTLQINMVNVGTSTVPCTRTSKTWTIKIIPKTCEHNYALGVEAAHPHKQFMKCTKCGDYYYTGKTGTLASCEICNPKAEHVHDLVLMYELPHPHAEIYKCKTCNYREYTGNYVTDKINCSICQSAVKKDLVLSAKRDYNCIDIFWEVEDVHLTDNFTLYRSINGKTFEKVYDVKDRTGYMDFDVKEGNTYRYYVEMERNGFIVGKSQTTEVQMKSTAALRKSIEKTKISSLKAKNSKGKITLTWKKSAAKYKVDGYVIWRSTKKMGTYKQYAKTNKQSFTSKNLPKKGKSYYYMVSGYRQAEDGITYYTQMSKVVGVKTKK